MAKRFAAEGANVAIVDVRGDQARRVADAIGGRTLAIEADVSSGKAVADAVGQTVQALGVPDIVVNNAGVTHRNRPIFEVNVKSIFNMVQAVVPLMRDHGGGAMINVGSTAGIRPRPGLTWYNASKGAVNLLSKSMAVELAPDGIRVCAIAPVMAETPLLPTFMGGDSPELRAQFKATVPLGRFATIDDVANATLFLASNEASFLTGNVLEVDGGRCV